LKQLEAGGSRLGSQFDAIKGTALNLAAAFGVTFSVSAVVAFGRELFRAADELTTLHDKTGISIEGLQRFQIAGDDAGNSLDELTAAIVKMEDKLVSGDKSAAGALAKLSLSFADLKGLSPERQFIAVSDAIRLIPEPAERVNVAIDLFGKAGASILPTLVRGFDDLKDAAVGMSRETVKTLDEAGDAWARYWRQAKGLGGEALAIMLQGMFDPVGARSFARALDEATASATKAGPSFKAIVAPGLPADLAEIEAGFAADAVAMTEAAKAAETFAAAMTELNAVGIDWHATLNDIDGETVEGIKYYLAAGVSQHALATAYGLTADQIKSVVSVMREEQDAAQALADKTKAQAEATRLAAQEAEDMGIAYQQAFDRAADAAERAVEETQRLADAAKRANEEINRALAFSTSATYQNFSDMVDAAITGYTGMNYGPNITEHGLTGMGGKGGAAFKLAEQGLSWEQILNVLVKGQPIPPNPGPRIPGFKEGGPVLQDGPIYAHAGEFVLPKGGGGSVTMHNVFNIVDTEANIARRVSAELARQLLRAQQVHH
jgi:hypothetical protein